MSADRRGAATVEFALVLPLLLLLLAGIIEFGQAFRIQHALSTTSRRGARAAVMEGSTSAQVRTKVQTDCSRILGVAASDVTVTIRVVPGGDDDYALQTAQAGDEISVNASIPFSKAGAGFFSNFFKDTVIRASCTMEHE